MYKITSNLHVPNTKHYSILHSRSVPWSIVSNAADWSSSTTALTSPLARARWTSFLIDSSAVSVE